MKSTTFGVGGFDPNKPDGNVVEEVEIPEPELTPEEIAKNSAIQKLQALGLTEEEALAIVGG
jgi:hypothetical protein